MGVMDTGCDNLQSVPAERGMALSAKHLITTVNLEDGSRTLGAILRVLGKHTDSLNHSRVTNMIYANGLDAMTILTSMDVAQSTLPLCRKEALALFGRTIPDKLATLRNNLSVVLHVGNVDLIHNDVFLKLPNLVMLPPDTLIELFDFDILLNIHLSRGHKAHLNIK